MGGMTGPKVDGAAQGACTVFIRWNPGYEPPESLAEYLSGLSLAQWADIMGPAPLADIDKLPPWPPEMVAWRDRCQNAIASNAE
jgi:hypothetical protein